MAPLSYLVLVTLFGSDDDPQGEAAQAIYNQFMERKMEDLFQALVDWDRMLSQAVKLLLAFAVALPIGLDRERATRLIR